MDNIKESMWGIKDWPDSVTENNQEVYSLISNAIKNKEKILVYYNTRFLGKFELLAGDAWFFYKRGGGKGMDEKEIMEFFNRFLSNDAYSVSAKEDPTLSIKILKGDEQIEEITGTGAASGSYQAPFQLKENENMEEKDIIEINEEQFNRMVKNVLLKEFVYASPAGSTTNTNTKSKPTESTAKASIKGAEANMKPNMEDKRPADVKNINAQGKQKEDEQIEREAGGMQDLEFDSLSDKAKENFKKQFTSGDNARSEKNIGNAAGDTTVGKDMLARAKKRAKSKKAATTPTVSLGSDIEVVGGEKKQKATMSENSELDPTDSLAQDIALLNSAIKNKKDIYVYEFDSEYDYEYDELENKYKKHEYIEEEPFWVYRSDISPEKLRDELLYVIKSGKFQYNIEKNATQFIIKYTHDLNTNPWINENVKNVTIKKYKLKDKSFLTEEFIDEYLTKYRKFYEGKSFFLEDAYGNRAKVNWVKKFPLIESIEDISKKKKHASLQKQLFRGEIDNSINSSRLNEHDIFVQMFKKSKNYIDED